MFNYISKTKHLVLITWLAVFSAFALVGLRDFLTNFEENRCDMTWMYEWPRYIKVPLWKGTSKRFPRYGLYLYGEGNYADESIGLRLSGIPVLFIPGNAGSYKQVRSLASVALRKAESLRSKVHFNYFTADLDESFSGLFGGVLSEQTEFIRLCVTRILWLYKRVPNPPTSVVLVGHSMGGLIARGLFTLSKFNPSLVHTIITFGTPHCHPIVALDPHMVEYYENVNSVWRTQGFVNDTEDRKLKNVTLVSVSGGIRDVLVRSSPSSMSQLSEPSQTLSVVTTSIPRVWVSVDHLCLCWCRQLVLVTTRALFDMIVVSKRQIMDDKKQRMKVFQHHFIQNPGFSTLNTGDTMSGMAKDSHPLVIHKRLWRFKQSGNAMAEEKLFAFPLDEWSTMHDSLMILTSIDMDHWLYGCHKTSGQACSTVSDLSHLARLFPWNKSAIKYAKLDLKYFPGMAYFAVRVPVSTKPSLLWSEFASYDSSLYEVELPRVLSKTTAVLDITCDCLFANISLKSVTKSWNVYVFDIEAMDCDVRTSVLIARIHVPWFNEDIYSFSNNGSTRLVLKLNHPRPKGNRENVQMHLWMDPKCSHRVTAQYDFYQTLGQIYRFYAVQLLCWTVSLVILVFAWQLSSMVNELHCNSFFSLVTDITKSIRVLLLVIQSHFFVSQFVLAYFVLKGYGGQHSWLPNIDDLKTFSWLLPLILIVSTAMVIVIFLFVWLGMFISLASILFSRFNVFPCLQTRLGIRDWVYAAVVVTTSLLFCGTLSLVLTFLFCLLRTWKYAAAVRAYKSRSLQQEDKRVLTLLESLGNFNLTLCVLLLLVIVVNLPPLAVWARNITLTYRLSSDHTVLFSVVIGVNVILCDPLTRVPHFLVYLCFLLSVAVTQAPIIPLYMIPYAICFLFTVLNISHFVAQFNTKKHKE